MKHERRQSARQATSQKEILVYAPGLGPLAKVKDISAGGLRIATPRSAGDGPRNRLIDLFVKAHPDFIVASIPCRIIYDIQHLSENATFSGSPNRIMGLEFEHLSRLQRRKLDALIQGLTKNH